MTAEEQIREILIERDIEAFIAGDFERARADFDELAFTGYSGASGILTLQYPNLESYGADWAAQAHGFRHLDPNDLARQLHAVQTISRLEVRDGRALATKLFDGEIIGPEGPTSLHWTTYYFLRVEESEQRWLITGFVGYLPTEWNPA